MCHFYHILFTGWRVLWAVALDTTTTKIPYSAPLSIWAADRQLSMLHIHLLQLVWQSWVNGVYCPTQQITGKSFQLLQAQSIPAHIQTGQFHTGQWSVRRNVRQVSWWRHNCYLAMSTLFFFCDRLILSPILSAMPCRHINTSNWQTICGLRSTEV